MKAMTRSRTCFRSSGRWITQHATYTRTVGRCFDGASNVSFDHTRCTLPYRRLTVADCWPRWPSIWRFHPLYNDDVAFLLLLSFSSHRCRRRNIQISNRVAMATGSSENTFNIFYMCHCFSCAKPAYQYEVTSARILMNYFIQFYWTSFVANENNRLKCSARIATSIGE